VLTGPILLLCALTTLNDRCILYRVMRFSAPLSVEDYLLSTHISTLLLWMNWPDFRKRPELWLWIGFGCCNRIWSRTGHCARWRSKQGFVPDCTALSGIVQTVWFGGASQKKEGGSRRKEDGICKDQRGDRRPCSAKAATDGCDNLSPSAAVRPRHR
jgi:hypothetical protein